MSKYTVGALRVFSGLCCICDVGRPVRAKSTWGESVELHTGDIVIVWHGQYIGTDIESWHPCDGITAIVSDDYRSFSDGTVELDPDGGVPYVMGIKGCGFDDAEWRIQVVKKYYDAIAGEHWSNYGFSFNHSESADQAIRKGAK